MKQFSSLDVCKWIKKYKDLIKSARITQAYRHGIYEITFSLHTKQGKKFLILLPPKAIIFSDNKPIAEHKETGFGKFLRNNIKGLIIQDISQVRSERVIEFSFNKGKMYVELFGKGNIIICDENNKIQSSIEKQIMKNRTISKGEIYEIPESFDIFNADEKEINEHIKKHDQEMNCSLFFATECNLGGKNSKNLCEKLKIKEDIKLKNIFGKGDIIKEKLNELCEEEQDFSEYVKALFENKENKFQSENIKKINKINNIIEQQTLNLNKIEKEIEYLTEVGNFIYNNYAFFDETIKAYNYSLENSLNFNEEVLKKIIEKHKINKKIKYKKPDLIIEDEK